MPVEREYYKKKNYLLILHIFQRQITISYTRLTMFVNLHVMLNLPYCSHIEQYCFFPHFLHLLLLSCWANVCWYKTTIYTYIWLKCFIWNYLTSTASVWDDGNRANAMLILIKYKNVQYTMLNWIGIRFVYRRSYCIWFQCGIGLFCGYCCCTLYDLSMWRDHQTV